MPRRPLNAADVRRLVATHREALVRDFGVRSLDLFGSVARGEAGPDSDVDLLAEFQRPVGLFDLIRLQYRLEEILGCRVDLGTRNSLRDRIRREIMDEVVHVV